MKLSQTQALVQLRTSLASSDNPLLAKILQSIDAATSDEHLFEVTLKLLKSLCVCMRDTLKAKEDTYNSAKNLIGLSKTVSTEGKVLDLYKKIYNNTCFNLKHDLSKHSNTSSESWSHTNCGKEDRQNENNTPKIEEDSVKNVLKSKLDHILYRALVQTRHHHKYNIKKYNLFGKAKSKVKSSLIHTLIVILTLHPEYKDLRKYNVVEEDLHKVLHKNSTIDIDIIDTKYDQKGKESEEAVKPEVYSDCHLQSLYTYLAESEKKNLTKVFRYLRRRDTIKIYIEVFTGRNHSDYINICCTNGSITASCKKELIEYIDSQENITVQYKKLDKEKSMALKNSFKNTISKLKQLVKRLDYKSFNNSTIDLNISNIDISNNITNTNTMKNGVLSMKESNSITDQLGLKPNGVPNFAENLTHPLKLRDVSRAIILLNDFVSKQTTTDNIKSPGTNQTDYTQVDLINTLALTEVPFTESNLITFKELSPTTISNLALFEENATKSEKEIETIQDMIHMITVDKQGGIDFNKNVALQLNDTESASLANSFKTKSHIVTTSAIPHERFTNKNHPFDSVFTDLDNKITTHGINTKMVSTNDKNKPNKIFKNNLQHKLSSYKTLKDIFPRYSTKSYDTNLTKMRPTKHFPPGSNRPHIQHVSKNDNNILNKNQDKVTRENEKATTAFKFEKNYLQVTGNISKYMNLLQLKVRNDTIPKPFTISISKHPENVINVYFPHVQKESKQDTLTTQHEDGNLTKSNKQYYLEHSTKSKAFQKNIVNSQIAVTAYSNGNISTINFGTKNTKNWRIKKNRTTTASKWSNIIHSYSKTTHIDKLRPKPFTSMQTSALHHKQKLQSQNATNYLKTLSKHDKLKNDSASTKYSFMSTTKSVKTFLTPNNIFKFKADNTFSERPIKIPIKQGNKDNQIKLPTTVNTSLIKTDPKLPSKNDHSNINSDFLITPHLGVMANHPIYKHLPTHTWLSMTTNKTNNAKTLNATFRVTINTDEPHIKVSKEFQNLMTSNAIFGDKNTVILNNRQLEVNNKTMHKINDIFANTIDESYPAADSLLGDSMLANGIHTERITIVPNQRTMPLMKSTSMPTRSIASDKNGYYKYKSVTTKMAPILNAIASASFDKTSRIKTISFKPKTIIPNMEWNSQSVMTVPHFDRTKTSEESSTFSPKDKNTVLNLSNMINNIDVDIETSPSTTTHNDNPLDNRNIKIKGQTSSQKISFNNQEIELNANYSAVLHTTKFYGLQNTYNHVASSVPVTTHKAVSSTKSSTANIDADEMVTNKNKVKETLTTSTIELTEVTNMSGLKLYTINYGDRDPIENTINFIETFEDQIELNIPNDKNNTIENYNPKNIVSNTGAVILTRTTNNYNYSTKLSNETERDKNSIDNTENRTDEQAVRNSSVLSINSIKMSTKPIKYTLPNTKNVIYQEPLMFTESTLFSTSPMSYKFKQSSTSTFKKTENNISDLKNSVQDIVKNINVIQKHITETSGSTEKYSLLKTKAAISEEIYDEMENSIFDTTAKKLSNLEKTRNIEINPNPISDQNDEEEFLTKSLFAENDESNSVYTTIEPQTQQNNFIKTFETVEKNTVPEIKETMQKEPCDFKLTENVVSQTNTETITKTNTIENIINRSKLIVLPTNPTFPQQNIPPISKGTLTHSQKNINDIMFSKSYNAISEPINVLLSSTMCSTNKNYESSAINIDNVIKGTNELTKQTLETITQNTPFKKPYNFLDTENTKFNNIPDSLYDELFATKTSNTVEIINASNNIVSKTKIADLTTTPTISQQNIKKTSNNTLKYNSKKIKDTIFTESYKATLEPRNVNITNATRNTTKNYENYVSTTRYIDHVTKITSSRNKTTQSFEVITKTRSNIEPYKLLGTEHTEFDKTSETIYGEMFDTSMKNKKDSTSTTWNTTNNFKYEINNITNIVLVTEKPINSTEIHHNTIRTLESITKNTPFTKPDDLLGTRNIILDNTSDLTMNKQNQRKDIMKAIESIENRSKINTNVIIPQINIKITSYNKTLKYTPKNIRNTMFTESYKGILDPDPNIKKSSTVWNTTKKYESNINSIAGINVETQMKDTSTQITRIPNKGIQKIKAFIKYTSPTTKNLTHTQLCNFSGTVNTIFSNTTDELNSNNIEGTTIAIGSIVNKGKITTHSGFLQRNVKETYTTLKDNSNDIEGKMFTESYNALLEPEDVNTSTTKKYENGEINAGHIDDETIMKSMKTTKTQNNATRKLESVVKYTSPITGSTTDVYIFHDTPDPIRNEMFGTKSNNKEDILNAVKINKSINDIKVLTTNHVLPQSNMKNTFKYDSMNENNKMFTESYNVILESKTDHIFATKKYGNDVINVGNIGDKTKIKDKSINTTKTQKFASTIKYTSPMTRSTTDEYTLHNTPDPVYNEMFRTNSNNKEDIINAVKINKSINEIKYLTSHHVFSQSNINSSFKYDAIIENNKMVTESYNAILESKTDHISTTKKYGNDVINFGNIGDKTKIKDKSINTTKTQNFQSTIKYTSPMTRSTTDEYIFYDTPDSIHSESFGTNTNNKEYIINAVKINESRNEIKDLTTNHVLPQSNMKSTFKYDSMNENNKMFTESYNVILESKTDHIFATKKYGNDVINISNIESYNAILESKTDHISTTEKYGNDVINFGNIGDKTKIKDKSINTTKTQKFASTIKYTSPMTRSTTDEYTLHNTPDPVHNEMFRTNSDNKEYIINAVKINESRNEIKALTTNHVLPQSNMKSTFKYNSMNENNKMFTESYNAILDSKTDHIYATKKYGNDVINISNIGDETKIKDKSVKIINTQNNATQKFASTNKYTSPLTTSTTDEYTLHGTPDPVHNEMFGTNYLTNKDIVNKSNNNKKESTTNLIFPQSKIKVTSYSSFKYNLKNIKDKMFTESYAISKLNNDNNSGTTQKTTKIYENNTINIGNINIQTKIKDTLIKMTKAQKFERVLKYTSPITRSTTYKSILFHTSPDSRHNKVLETNLNNTEDIIKDNEMNKSSNKIKGLFTARNTKAASHSILKYNSTNIKDEMFTKSYNAISEPRNVNKSSKIWHTTKNYENSAISTENIHDKAKMNEMSMKTTETQDNATQKFKSDLKYTLEEEVRNTNYKYILHNIPDPIHYKVFKTNTTNTKDFIKTIKKRKIRDFTTNPIFPKINVKATSYNTLKYRPNNTKGFGKETLISDLYKYVTIHTNVEESSTIEKTSKKFEYDDNNIEAIDKLYNITVALSNTALPKTNTIKPRENIIKYKLATVNTTNFKELDNLLATQNTKLYNTTEPMNNKWFSTNSKNTKVLTNVTENIVSTNKATNLTMNPIFLQRNIEATLNSPVKYSLKHKKGIIFTESYNAISKPMNVKIPSTIWHTPKSYENDVINVSNIDHVTKVTDISTNATRTRNYSKQKLETVTSRPFETLHKFLATKIIQLKRTHEPTNVLNSIFLQNIITTAASTTKYTQTILNEKLLTVTESTIFMTEPELKNNVTSKIKTFNNNLTTIGHKPILNNIASESHKSWKNVTSKRTQSIFHNLKALTKAMSVKYFTSKPHTFVHTALKIKNKSNKGITIKKNDSSYLKTFWPLDATKPILPVLPTNLATDLLKINTTGLQEQHKQPKKMNTLVTQINHKTVENSKMNLKELQFSRENTKELMLSKQTPKNQELHLQVLSKPFDFNTDATLKLDLHPSSPSSTSHVLKHKTTPTVGKIQMMNTKKLVNTATPYTVSVTAQSYQEILRPTLSQKATNNRTHHQTDKSFVFNNFLYTKPIQKHDVPNKFVSNVTQSKSHKANGTLATINKTSSVISESTKLEISKTFTEPTKIPIYKYNSLNPMIFPIINGTRHSKSSNLKTIKPDEIELSIRVGIETTKDRIQFTLVSIDEKPKTVSHRVEPKSAKKSSTKAFVLPLNVDLNNGNLNSKGLTLMNLTRRANDRKEVEKAITLSNNIKQINPPETTISIEKKPVTVITNSQNRWISNITVGNISTIDGGNKTSLYSKQIIELVNVSSTVQPTWKQHKKIVIKPASLTDQFTMENLKHMYQEHLQKLKKNNNITDKIKIKTQMYVTNENIANSTFTATKKESTMIKNEEEDSDSLFRENDNSEDDNSMFVPNHVRKTKMKNFNNVAKEHNATYSTTHILLSHDNVTNSYQYLTETNKPTYFQDKQNKIPITFEIKDVKLQNNSKFNIKDYGKTKFINDTTTYSTDIKGKLHNGTVYITPNQNKIISKTNMSITEISNISVGEPSAIETKQRKKTLTRKRKKLINALKYKTDIADLLKKLVKTKEIDIKKLNTTNKNDIIHRLLSKIRKPTIHINKSYIQNKSTNIPIKTNYKKISDEKLHEEYKTQIDKPTRKSYFSHANDTQTIHNYQINKPTDKITKKENGKKMSLNRSFAMISTIYLTEVTKKPESKKSNPQLFSGMKLDENGGVLNSTKSYKFFNLSLNNNLQKNPAATFNEIKIKDKITKLVTSKPITLKIIPSNTTDVLSLINNEIKDQTDFTKSNSILDDDNKSNLKWTTLTTTNIKAPNKTHFITIKISIPYLTVHATTKMTNDELEKSPTNVNANKFTPKPKIITAMFNYQSKDSIDPLTPAAFITNATQTSINSKVQPKTFRDISGISHSLEILSGFTSNDRKTDIDYVHKMGSAPNKAITTQISKSTLNDFLVRRHVNEQNKSVTESSKQVLNDINLNIANKSISKYNIYNKFTEVYSAISNANNYSKTSKPLILLNLSDNKELASNTEHISKYGTNLNITKQPQKHFFNAVSNEIPPGNNSDLSRTKKIMYTTNDEIMPGEIQKKSNLFLKMIENYNDNPDASITPTIVTKVLNLKQNDLKLANNSILEIRTIAHLYNKTSSNTLDFKSTYGLNYTTSPIHTNALKEFEKDQQHNKKFHFTSSTVSENYLKPTVATYNPTIFNKKINIYADPITTTVRFRTTNNNSQSIIALLSNHQSSSMYTTKRTSNKSKKNDPTPKSSLNTTPYVLSTIGINLNQTTSLVKNLHTTRHVKLNTFETKYRDGSNLPQDLKENIVTMSSLSANTTSITNQADFKNIYNEVTQNPNETQVDTTEYIQTEIMPSLLKIKNTTISERETKVITNFLKSSVNLLIEHKTPNREKSNFGNPQNTTQIISTNAKEESNHTSHLIAMPFNTVSKIYILDPKSSKSIWSRYTRGNKKQNTKTTTKIYQNSNKISKSFTNINPLSKSYSIDKQSKNFADMTITVASHKSEMNISYIKEIQKNETQLLTDMTVPFLLNNSIHQKQASNQLKMRNLQNKISHKVTNISLDTTRNSSKSKMSGLPNFVTVKYKDKNTKYTSKDRFLPSSYKSNNESIPISNRKIKYNPLSTIFAESASIEGKNVKIYSSRLNRYHFLRPPLTVTNHIKYNTYQPPTEEDNEGPTLKPKISARPNISCAILKTMRHKFHSTYEFIEFLKASNCSADNLTIHFNIKNNRFSRPPSKQNPNRKTSNIKHPAIKLTKKVFTKLGSKESLLNSFEKTKLYPVKPAKAVLPKLPPNIVKRINIGGVKKKEIMSMNTRDFFSQHRLATPSHLKNQKVRQNNPLFVNTRYSILRPKFHPLEVPRHKIDRPKTFFMPPRNEEETFAEIFETPLHHKKLNWKQQIGSVRAALQNNPSALFPTQIKASVSNVLDKPHTHPKTDWDLFRDKTDLSKKKLWGPPDFVPLTWPPTYDLSLPKPLTPTGDEYNLRQLQYRRNFQVVTPTPKGEVTDWWLNDMYLKVRLPLPINSNPGMVFPRRHFAKMEEVADLGALFIDDILDYKEMLDRGELPLERATSREKGQPLCMEQFYRLLGVCRIPEVGKDRLELPAVKSGKEEQEELVVVACRNYFYPIPVKAVDRGRITPGEIQAQLLHAMVDAAGAPPAPRIGLLTSMNRDQWARAREHLIKDEMNRMNLELISRALCILCLDEAGGDRADTDPETNAMLRAMHGAGTRHHSANRWFDKTVQLIISSDGTVGMCYEHSSAEGVAVVRLAERALARAEVADRPAPPPALLPAPQAMKWNIVPEVQRTIEHAARELDRAISDLDFKVYTYRGYGREFMKSCRTSPDVYIQLAIQYAYYKMYGYLVTTYESASLRRFRQGRVDNIRSAHGAALAWAAAMCTADASPLNDGTDEGQKKVSFNLYGEQKKIELFEEAARKQTSIMEANILGKGIDNHLLGLREMARETLGELPPVFCDTAYKQMFEFKMSTSQVTTTTDGTFMGYGAVCPDGYGCCYNPKKDSIIFCIASFTSSPVTNTEAYRQSLEEALDSMKLMFQARKAGN
ncbi:unnamed protein product [Arctia plantaginis]|uniref:Choline O-acetyltransferase n=1 Tax=Arctia plantaginis TaxID=874455 RepID=A0A8S0Z2X2_ARCPL|nr:unnamed protein product [Arctia plantaginis]